MLKNPNITIVSTQREELCPFKNSLSYGSSAFTYWKFSNGACIRIQVFHSLWLPTHDWTNEIIIHPSHGHWYLQACDLLETLKYVQTRMEKFACADKRSGWKITIQL